MMSDGGDLTSLGVRKLREARWTRPAPGFAPDDALSDDRQASPDHGAETLQDRQRHTRSMVYAKQTLCITAILIVGVLVVTVALDRRPYSEASSAAHPQRRASVDTITLPPARLKSSDRADSTQRSAAATPDDTLIIRAVHRGIPLDSALFVLKPNGETKTRVIRLRPEHEHRRSDLPDGLAIFSPGYGMKVVPAEDLPVKGEAVIELPLGATLRLELLGLPPHVFTDYQILLGLKPDMHMLPSALQKPLHVTNVSRRISSPLTEIPLAAAHGGRIQLTVFDKHWMSLGTLAKKRFRAGQEAITIDCSGTIDFSALRRVDARLIFPDPRFMSGRLELELEDAHGSSTARKRFDRRGDDRAVTLSFGSVEPGQYTMVLESADARDAVLGDIVVEDDDVRVTYTIRADAGITIRPGDPRRHGTVRGVKLWDRRGTYLGFERVNDEGATADDAIRINRLIPGTYFLQAVGTDAVSRPAKVIVGASETSSLYLPLQESGDVIVSLDSASSEAIAVAFRNTENDELRGVVRSGAKRFTLPAGTWQIRLGEKSTSVEIRPGQTARWDVKD